MCIPYTIRVYFVNPCIKKILLSRCRKVVHCVHMKINVATTYKKIGFALNFFAPLIFEELLYELGKRVAKPGSAFFKTSKQKGFLSHGKIRLRLEEVVNN